ncbi:MAG: hypothetical protein ACRDTG_10885 [Pseudonocardiaceae bacterium]
MHLTELDETFSQRHHWRDPIVLCSADVSELDNTNDPYDTDEECPGCQDCLRYCPECLHEAARFSVEAGQLDQPSAQGDEVDADTAGVAAGTGRG